jgi:hypothetical protein
VPTRESRSGNLLICRLVWDRPSSARPTLWLGKPAAAIMLEGIPSTEADDGAGRRVTVVRFENDFRMAWMSGRAKVGSISGGRTVTGYCRSGFSQQLY